MKNYFQLNMPKIHLHRLIPLIILMGLLLIATIPASAQQTITIYRIDVATDGSAIWLIEASVGLTSQSAADAWNQTYLEGQASYLQQFENDMIDSVGESSQITGRTMQAKDFILDFDVSQANGGMLTGKIRYTFTWDGFAAVSDGVIEVGDAFVDGFLIEPVDTLYITPPSGYIILSTSSTADEFSGNSAVWSGDVDTDTIIGMRVFDTGQPQALMESTIEDATTTSSPAPGLIIAMFCGFAAIIYYRRK